MNNSSINDSCMISTDFVSSPILMIFVILQIFMGTVSAVGNAMLMVAVWRMSLFHTNLRWLLVNLSLNLFWYGTATVIKAIHFLVICLIGDPCLFLVDSVTNKIWEMLYITPFLNTIYSIMAVGLERLFSTARYRTYDKSKVPWLACLFIPAIWMVTLGNQIWIISILVSLPVQMLPASFGFLFTPRNTVLSMLVTNIVLEILGLSLISGLYAWNVYKRDRAVNICVAKREYNLAARFQIIQNVDVGKFLLPSMVANACAHLPNSAFLLLLIFGLDLSLSTKIILMNFTYVWFTVYGTIHACLAFSRHSALKAKFVHWAPTVVTVFGCWKTKINYSHRPSATTDAHFDMLGRLWSSNKANAVQPAPVPISSDDEQLRSKSKCEDAPIENLSLA